MTINTGSIIRSKVSPENARPMVGRDAERGLWRNEMEINDMLGEVYNELEGSEAMAAYSARHGIESAAVLTVYDDEAADLIASYIGPKIRGKVVVEIGGGIGLLAFHLGQYAERVYCIEANPMWSWIFAGSLLEQKPKNVSYLFGAASEFVGLIKANVAIFCTHSGVKSMREVGYQFAPIVMDVYGELIALDPSKFDKLAQALRKVA